MQKEEWKPVIGFEGIYEVSNSGKIRSLDRTATICNVGVRWEPKAYTRMVRGRVLKLFWSNYPGGKRYLSAVLCDERGKKYLRKAHRLVAVAFVPNPHSYRYIRFRDGDASNVSAENLEWTNSKGGKHG